MTRAHAMARPLTDDPSRRPFIAGFNWPAIARSAALTAPIAHEALATGAACAGAAANTAPEPSTNARTHRDAAPAMSRQTSPRPSNVRS
ncbi:hypothetical protein GCM10010168_76490 [Actinoplanes ianthinogenes]|uniref:Uncharacterized protein n=1 Tax=Actinoplanes ianthinogenes TaxID=122358 RepID=A0ABN6CTF8_9ACTN|nr:hypothetical protein Aiant_90820 [Actinoplanes ianthinogenes]GGR46481.1 hypothetical protein GCM10010168_76490 [Actinoplanes ianthinogenes]